MPLSHFVIVIFEVTFTVCMYLDADPSEIDTVTAPLNENGRYFSLCWHQLTAIDSCIVAAKSYFIVSMWFWTCVQDRRADVSFPRFSMREHLATLLSNTHLLLLVCSIDRIDNSLISIFICTRNKYLIVVIKLTYFRECCTLTRTLSQSLTRDYWRKWTRLFASKRQESKRNDKTKHSHTNRCCAYNRKIYRVLVTGRQYWTVHAHNQSQHV